MTAPYQTDAPASISTSPINVAVGATKASGCTRGALPSKEKSGIRGTVLCSLMGPGGRSLRRGVAMGVASVVLAACASGGDAEGSGEEQPPGGSSTTTTASGDRPHSGDVTTTARKAATTTTAARSGGTTSTVGRVTSTTRAGTAADTGARGSPGSYARTLLQARGAQRIVVEPLVQGGAEPRQGTLDHLVALLREASGKPVVTAGAVALPAGDGTSDDDDIRALSDAHGRTAQSGEQGVLRVLFLAGEYTPTDTVLGVAVRGDTAAVFPHQVRDASSPLISRASLERAVAAHELGHLLGLVDLVVDTGRDDPEHEGHSRNRGSVMYWAIESSLVGQVLNGPPPDDFDAADRNDLSALRNGG